MNQKFLSYWIIEDEVLESLEIATQQSGRTRWQKIKHEGGETEKDFILELGFGVSSTYLFLKCKKKIGLICYLVYRVSKSDAVSLKETNNGLFHLH